MCSACTSDEGPTIDRANVWAGTIEGMRYEGLVMCVYEFSDEKIQQVRTVYDRLLVAKQVAKGWLAKWVVGLIVKNAEKELR